MTTMHDGGLGEPGAAGPSRLTIDDLTAVDTPRTITPANRDSLALFGTRAVERVEVYLVRPAVDLTWIETDQGDVAVRPGDTIAYDPATKRAWRVGPDDLTRYELVPTDALAAQHLALGTTEADLAQAGGAGGVVG